MSADFTPVYNAPADLKPFRYWCQKVLPLVYDDTLSYYELLCKVVDYLNKTMEDVNTLSEDVEALHTAYEQLQDYVNTYFENLDIQTEINNKLDQMAASGALNEILDPVIIAEVEDWLEENITPTTPAVDASLSIEGAAADAKAVGTLAFLQKHGLTTSTDLNTLTQQNGYYSLTASGVYTHAPEGTGRRFLLIYATGGTSQFTMQVLINQTAGKIYMRHYIDNAWSAWTETPSMDETFRNFNYLPDNSDFNSVTGNGYYGLAYTATYTNAPSGIAGSRCILFSLKLSEPSNYRQQIVYNVSTSDIYMRYYIDNAWSDWAKNVNADETFKRLGTLASGSDLNSVTGSNGYYIMGAGSSYTNAPTEIASSGRRILFLINAVPPSTYKQQWIFNYNNATIYFRYYADGSWSAWTNTPNVNNAFLAKASPAANTDANNWTEYGCYVLGASAAYVHIPETETTGRRYVLVFKTAGTGTFRQQIFINQSTGYVYLRFYADEVWSAWKKLPALDEICGMSQGRKCCSHAGILEKQAYENSPRAFILARKKGIFIQDLDVMFSSDNVAVVAHPGISDINGTPIDFAGSTLAQLKALTLGDSDYSWTIQTLEEAVQLNQDLGCRIGIDVGDNTQLQTTALSDLCDFLRDNKIDLEYIVTSDRRVLEAMGPYAADLPLGVVFGRTDDETQINNKLSTLATIKSNLSLSKTWIFARYDHLYDSDSAWIGKLSTIQAAGHHIAVYAFNTVNFFETSYTLPVYYEMIMSEKYNVNYERFIRAISF